MAGYSGLDFGSVHDEVTYWMNNTSSLFKGGQSGSGENGNDFSMPTGTPVYAVTSGTLAGAGFYGGGGVVSVEQYPGRTWYYQHLDLLNVDPANVGKQQIAAGQLIGYSGGQNTGGYHPSQLFFSTYPHIEVGIDAPWGGIWGGDNNIVNGTPESIDPRPTLQQIQVATATGNVVPTNGNNTAPLPPIMQYSTTSSGGFLGQSSNQPPPPQCTPPTVPDPILWAQYAACMAQNTNPAQALGGAIGQGFQAAINSTGIGGIANLFYTQYLRIFKGIVGGFLIVASVLILILPDIAATATAALGFPEAAPAVYEAVKHPTGARPHQIVTQAYTFRQQQKQNALRNARYNEQVRRYMERQARQARASQASQAAGAQEQQIQRQREEIGREEAPRREEIAKRTMPPPGSKPTTPTPATPTPATPTPEPPRHMPILPDAVSWLRGNRRKRAAQLRRQADIARVGMLGEQGARGRLPESHEKPEPNPREIELAKRRAEFQRIRGQYAIDPDESYRAGYRAELRRLIKDIRDLQNG